jgi:hypothetical protein
MHGIVLAFLLHSLKTKNRLWKEGVRQRKLARNHLVVRLYACMVCFCMFSCVCVCVCRVVCLGCWYVMHADLVRHMLAAKTDPVVRVFVGL